jgi:hypothetical protein
MKLAQYVRGSHAQYRCARVCSTDLHGDPVLAQYGLDALGVERGRQQSSVHIKGALIAR